MFCPWILIRWFSIKHACVFLAHSLEPRNSRPSVCAHRVKRRGRCWKCSAVVVFAWDLFDFLCPAGVVGHAIIGTGPSREELDACFGDDTVASIRAVYALSDAVLPHTQATQWTTEAQRALRRCHVEHTPDVVEAPHMEGRPCSCFGVPVSATRCEVGQQLRGDPLSTGTAVEHVVSADDLQASWGPREDAECGGGKQGSGVASSVFEEESPAEYALRGGRGGSQAITFTQVRRQLSGHSPYPIAPASRAALNEWVKAHNRVAAHGVRPGGGGRCLCFVTVPNRVCSWLFVAAVLW